MQKKKWKIITNRTGMLNFSVHYKLSFPFLLDVKQFAYIHWIWKIFFFLSTWSLFFPREVNLLGDFSQCLSLYSVLTLKDDCMN